MEYTKEGLGKFLNEQELKGLHELVNHPYWYLLEKVNTAIKEDWIDQTANLDFSTKTDEEVMRVMRMRNGMLKGISLFLGYLAKKTT